MGVAHVKEVTDRDQSRDKIGNKRYTRTFQVLCDKQTDGAKVVLEDPDVPDYGDTWVQVESGGAVTDTDTDAFVVDKRASQNDRENLQNWTVTVSYAGRADPVREPPEVSWAAVKYQKAIAKDVKNLPIANKAGDPFEGGLTVDRSRMVLTIRQNVLDFDPTDAVTYLNTLNELPFLLPRHPPLGFLAGQCQLVDLSGELVWLEDAALLSESGRTIHYWRRTAKVEVAYPDWTLRPLNAGFNQKLAVPVFGIDKVPIALPAGGRPSSPYPLDASGFMITSIGSATYLAFEGYESKDWTPLNLEY